MSRSGSRSVPHHRSRRALARFLPALAALVLLAGYASLATGSVSAAPLLLVAGYVVVVPWAILRG